MAEKSDDGSDLCILVTSSPESENSRTLAKLTEAAIEMGQRVQIFLMCDGVYHILQEDFLSLAKKGAEITLCSLNASQRGVENRPGIRFGSQYDFASMMAHSDNFIALT